MTAVANQKPICSVCKLSDHSAFFMCKEGYDLYRCDECHHIFVWPIPTIQELRHIYSFENSYQVQPITIFDQNTGILEKHRESLKQIERLSPRRGRLLDVGCSSGEFLWLAKRDGWSVCGVELSKDTAEIATANGIEVFVGELASAGLPASSFDAIHVGDVIEHVRDPGELLSQARALLKTDGVLVMVTPNHDALFPLLTYWLYRLFNMPWSHPTPPYHLNQFSEKSLDRLVRRVNLKTIDRQYQRCELDYELGETHVLRSFREAIRKRRLGVAAGRLLFAGLTAVSYAMAYGIDRCCVWKKKDFDMRFILRKPPSYEAPAESSRNVTPDDMALR